MATADPKRSLSFSVPPKPEFPEGERKFRLEIEGFEGAPPDSVNVSLELRDEHGVRSAYLDLTLPLLRYRLGGIFSEPSG